MVHVSLCVFPLCVSASVCFHWIHGSFGPSSQSPASVNPMYRHCAICGAPVSRGQKKKKLEFFGPTGVRLRAWGVRGRDRVAVSPRSRQAVGGADGFGRREVRASDESFDRQQSVSPDKPPAATAAAAAGWQQYILLAFHGWRLCRRHRGPQGQAEHRRLNWGIAAAVGRILGRRRRRRVGREGFQAAAAAARLGKEGQVRKRSLLSVDCCCCSEIATARRGQPSRGSACGR